MSNYFFKELLTEDAHWYARLQQDWLVQAAVTALCSVAHVYTGH